MKRPLIILLAILLAFNTAVAQISFSGNSHDVITIQPQASTGLNNIYVLYNTEGVTINYKPTSSEVVNWYRFSNLGGAYSDLISNVVYSDGVYSLPKIEGDMGYIVEEGTKRTYFWIVNYSSHALDLQSLTVAAEQDCSMTTLIAEGRGEKIHYYTINGRQMELDRELFLQYTTLQWDEESEYYAQVETIESFSHLPEIIYTPAPLCDTDFVLTGDRFLRHWQEIESVSSPIFSTIAVEAKTTAIQTERENDNEQKEDGTMLGGSAPIEITFSAAVTDAAIFREWQMSESSEFENLIKRFNELETTYTFEDYGTYYVRFMASNAAGTCDYYSDVYEISIGESRLDCPNAFSPGATEGVNDEWKVSYKSIISFECHIFNRWGIKVAEFNDPSQGWDGRHGGKVVPAGVYYYVIKARGADGKNYDLKGDINIINYSGTLNGTTTNPE